VFARVCALLLSTVVLFAVLPTAPVEVAPVANVAAVTSVVAPASRWVSPVDGQLRVARPFAPPPQPWLPGHRGVDLVAGAGTPVRAAGAGVVAFAGPVAGVGVVSIDHPGGLRTTYEPLVAVVRAGQAVATGDVIGALAAGHPGCPFPVCLHWGLRRGATYLDPLALLRPVRVRLKPLGTARAARAGPRPSGRSVRAGCRPARRAARTVGRTRRRRAPGSAVGTRSPAAAVQPPPQRR
jgi:murein DD-endopeptidase MepM/ murein hydrolase activator NlpD